MSSSKYLAKAFTLVELIVVISVLAILATIAFTQISNVTLSARNSTRMTNLQSISSSLNLYIATNGVYPIPDNKTDIMYSGSVIGYQGYIKDTAARILKLSANTSQDPLNTSSYFSYATNASRTDAQILGFLEANTTSFKALPATFASDELATKTPYSKGEELGMLYTSGTTTPLTDTSIDLNTTANSYAAYYNSTDSLSWTGNLLQNLVISYAHGSGFGSPSADDCPTGFIPVPGNKDFNQPGFCVAKYEMKQAIGDAGSYTYGEPYSSNNDQISPYCNNITPCNSTGARNFTNPIISKADGYPLMWINQYNAIEACKAMGPGYHLITNNEWMTIARNIELNSANWSGNAVGSGYIFLGHSDKVPSLFLQASPDDNNPYYQTLDSSTSPGDSDTSIHFTENASASFLGQKRTLTLSNGQIIWDLAGNTWEHVNKANTLDGTDYNTGLSWFSSGTQTPLCPFSGANLFCFEMNTGTGNIALSSMILPLGNYTKANGVGIGFYPTGIANNVFLRGWDHNGWMYTGIYATALSWRSHVATTVWFRCAK